MGVIVSRKFLAGFLIIAILSLMLPVHQAHAGAKELGKTFLTSAGKVAKAAPGFLWGAAKVGAGIIGTAMLLKFLSGVIVELAGLIFNMSLGLTLDNENYSSSKIDAIDAGWTFSRDVVNIFFIFILLFIAIATILGIESYGAKSLLARLIVVALLVNFSLLATRGIIYVSNSLAVQIYNSQVNIGDTAGTAGALSGFLNLKFKKNLGEQVMNRFYLKQLYEKAPKPDSASALANELLGFGTIELGAIVVALLAAFLLFVASFLFITRMAVLWLLMILAPFGFVFLILPATRSYAQQWWKKLIDQAVFAPAFLFLFFIALKVLDKLGDFMGKANDIKSTNEYLALILLQITIAFILLFASLMVAKQLGTYGADGAIGMAKKSGAAFGKYVGRGAARRAMAPIRAAGRTAGSIQRSDSAGARLFKAIPGVQRGLGRMEATSRKGIEQREKDLEAMNLSASTLKNRAALSTVGAEEKAAIVNMLAKKDNLTPQGNFDRSHIDAAARLYEAQGMGVNARTIRSLEWQYARNETERADALNRGTVKPTDIKKNDFSAQYFATGAANQPVRDAMYNNFNESHIHNMMERDDNSANDFFNNLGDDMAAAGIPRTIADLQTFLETRGNRRLSAWTRTPAGQSVMRAYGFT